MRHTEFWDVLDRAFPNGRGRALAKDLALPELNSRTAEEALDQGEKPQTVWRAIRISMDLPERFEYLHKISPKDL